MFVHVVDEAPEVPPEAPEAPNQLAGAGMGGTKVNSGTAMCRTVPLDTRKPGLLSTVWRF